MAGRVAMLAAGLVLGVVLLVGTGIAGQESGQGAVAQPAQKNDLGLGEALWTAASTCDKATLTKLLDAGAQVNITWGPRRTTPLMEAVRAYDNKCPEEVAEILVKAGAELDRQDSHGFTVLHWLASRNCVQTYVDALKYLLAQGADPTIRDYQCRTPLELAAEQGCVDKMKPLAQYMKKAKPRPPDPNDPCRQSLPNPEPELPTGDQE